MARIRSIKPDIASDAKLAGMPSDVFRTFILCISQADDYGLLTGSPRALAGILYPATESVDGRVLAKWVGVLVTHGFLRRLTSQDGLPILHIVNWTKHQRIEKPSASALSRSLEAATFADVTRKLRESVTRSPSQNDESSDIASAQNDAPSVIPSSLEVGRRKKEVGGGKREMEEGSGAVQGYSPAVVDLPPRETATAGSHDPKPPQRPAYPYSRRIA